eukprot:m.252797 g.252797  ORF g.252797 m.252797 type:complete len:284 (+) comp10991_c0_seq6:227-1078(+)
MELLPSNSFPSCGGPAPSSSSSKPTPTSSARPKPSPTAKFFVASVFGSAHDDNTDCALARAGDTLSVYRGIHDRCKLVSGEAFFGMVELDKDGKADLLKFNCTDAACTSCAHFFKTPDVHQCASSVAGKYSAILSAEGSPCFVGKSAASLKALATYTRNDGKCAELASATGFELDQCIAWESKFAKLIKKDAGFELKAQCDGSCNMCEASRLFPGDHCNGDMRLFAANSLSSCGRQPSKSVMNPPVIAGVVVAVLLVVGVAGFFVYKRWSKRNQAAYQLINSE